MRNALDYRTRYFHDAYGNVTRRIDPDSQDELFEYNGFSQVTAWTDRGNVLWDSVYDSDGNLTEHILPDDDDDPGDPDTFDNNPRWTYTYDADGNGLTEEDPLGFVTTYDVRLARSSGDDHLSRRRHEREEQSHGRNDLRRRQQRRNAHQRTRLHLVVRLRRHEPARRGDATRRRCNAENNPVYAWAYDAAGNLSQAPIPYCTRPSTSMMS